MSLTNWLKDAIQQERFSDLHADLIGMGSAEFWINRIMKDLIPRLVKEKKIEWYMTKDQLTFANVLGKAPARNFCEGDAPKFEYIAEELLEWCEPGIRTKLKNGNRNFNFTYDVVYSTERLMQTFNVDSVDYLAWDLGTDSGEFTRTPYIVWNAKNQQFEERQGITNSRLLQLLETKTGLLDRLATRFAVLDGKGNAPNKNIVFNLFRTVSLSKIYLMHHALKESMCEQYLEIFDELISHLVTDIYIPSGIGYVEFSVAYSAITKPWVFKHLYNAMMKHNRDYISIRYLVNFQQNDESTPAIGEAMKNRLDLDGLLGLPADEYRLYMQHLANDYYIFGKSVAMLQELKVKLNNDLVAQKFMHVVVGFDYTGDKEHPFCPFGLTEFTDFVKDCRVKYNERFGFHFHCNKFNVDNELPTDDVYMLIIGQIIQNIINAFPVGSPVPLRMGSAIAFLTFEGKVNRPARALGPIDKEMINTFGLMKSRQVVIGLNIKTNELALVHNLKNPEDLVKRFHDMGFAVALCSDSDGVWNSAEMIDGKTFRSLISGFIQLIRTNVITSESFGNELINNSTSGRFDDIPFRKRADPELYAKAIVIVTEEKSKQQQQLEELRKQVSNAQKPYIKRIKN